MQDTNEPQWLPPDTAPFDTRVLVQIGYKDCPEEGGVEYDVAQKVQWGDAVDEVAWFSAREPGNSYRYGFDPNGEIWGEEVVLGWYPAPRLSR